MKLVNREWCQYNKEVTLVHWGFFLGKGSQKSGNRIRTFSRRGERPPDSRSI